MRYFKNPVTKEIYPISKNFKFDPVFLDNASEIDENDIDPTLHTDTLVYGEYKGIKYAVSKEILASAMKVQRIDFIKYVENVIDHQLDLENN